MENFSMNNHQRPNTLDQLREFSGTISLHRWGILLATVALAAISIVVISLLPDSYIASTSVLFDPQKLPERYVAPTVTADPAQRLNTLTQEVLSTGRLQLIAQDFHLYADPRKTSQHEIVDQMRKSITIEMKPNSEREMSAFMISYTGQDPQLVAAVANRLAQSFIDWDLANREQVAASTTAFMTAQLQDAKQKLDNEEGKIDEYKRKYSGELPEQLQSNMQSLSTLHGALQANRESLNHLEQEATMLTAIPVTASASSERDRLETELRTLQAELTKLRAQYTERYPDVIAAKDRVEVVTKQLNRMDFPGSSTAVSSSQVRLQIIKHETERLQAEQKILTGKINRYQAEVDATALRSQEIEYLSRNYEGAREQYEAMVDKKFQAEMAVQLEHEQKTSRFTVDPAQVPDKPIKPNRLLLLLLTLPFCGIVPAGIAIAGTEVRGTVNTEQSLRSLLPGKARVIANIPIIETVPDLRKRRRMALVSILGSLICCTAVAVFLFGGTATRMRHSHAHGIVPSNPTAKVSSQP